MKTPPPSSQPKLTVSTVFICFSTVFRNGFQRFSQFSHVWQYIAAYIPCMCHSFHTFDSILQHTSLAYVPHGALDRGYSPPKSEPTKRGSACFIFVETSCLYRRHSANIHGYLAPRSVLLNVITFCLEDCMSTHLHLLHGQSDGCL